MRVKALARKQERFWKGQFAPIYNASKARADMTQESAEHVLSLHVVKTCSPRQCYMLRITQSEPVLS